MQNLLTIQLARQKSLKQYLKIRLGYFLSRWNVESSRRLRHSPTSYPNGLIEKLILSYLREQALISEDTRFFERLHESFWRGTGGEVFSRNCDHRFDQLFLKQQSEDFNRLSNYWRQSGCCRLVELGCCSGQHLQFFTRNLTDVESALGIDINQSQIETNKLNQEFDSRVQFFCGDAADWVLREGRSNTLFISNGGVLEYFSQARLTRMLRHISNRLSPSLFFAVEPIAADHDLDHETNSIPFGKELSFSHNYKYLFESNRFSVVYQHHVDFESWRMQTTIAAAP